MGMTNDSNFTGVFVNNATIVSAESVSNQDVYKNGKPVDVGVRLKLEIGKSFQPEVLIAGNLKVEGNKTSWGGAMKVKIFLNDMRVQWKELAPDNSIPQEILDQLIGKEITRLQYPSSFKEDGKANYRTYSRIVLASFKDNKTGKTGEQFLREKYEADVAAGYVKPAVKDESTEFPGSEHETAPVAQDNF